MWPATLPLKYTLDYIQCPMGRMILMTYVPRGGSEIRLKWICDQECLRMSVCAFLGVLGDTVESVLLIFTSKQGLFECVWDLLLAYTTKLLNNKQNPLPVLSLYPCLDHPVAYICDLFWQTSFYLLHIQYGWIGDSADDRLPPIPTVFLQTASRFSGTGQMSERLTFAGLMHLPAACSTICIRTLACSAGVCKREENRIFEY